MTDREHGHDFKPIAGAVYALAATGAVALIVGLAAVVVPRPAGALPAYAQQTGLACGRCHVSPAGGGPRTAFGNAFAANGHKVPATGGKPGKSSGGGQASTSPVVPALRRRRFDYARQPRGRPPPLLHALSLRPRLLLQSSYVTSALRLAAAGNLGSIQIRRYFNSGFRMAEFTRGITHCVFR